MKIHKILQRALTHLAPGPLQLDDGWKAYNQRVEADAGHKFICHAVLQAEQELAGEPYVFPMPLQSWADGNPVVMFLEELGMPANHPWPVLDQVTRYQMERFDFLYMAYLIAKDENL